MTDSRGLHRYLLHGCLLDSTFPISGLTLVEGRLSSPPLRVSLDRERTLFSGDESAYIPWRPDDVLPQDPAFRLQFLKGPGDYLVRFRGHADYAVALDGKRIRLHTPATEPSSLVRDILVGPIFAIALVLQDTFALHGSCVGRDGFAISFIGTNGIGKSTLAAAYVADGWELLTDGMFVARIEDGRAFVQPGDPRIRMRPGTAAMLQDLPSVDSAENAARGKANVPIGGAGWGQFSGSPQRLGVAYVLSPAEPQAGVSIEACTGADALISLTANTYGAGSFENEALARHFKFVERFARAVPLRRLHYGKRIENMAAMREAIDRDAASFRD